YQLQALVGPDLLQDLQSIDLRQFQVEKHDRRVVVGASAELAPTIEVIESFFSVASDHDLVCQVIFGQRGQSQFDVSRVVLDQQNASQSTHDVFTVLSG